MTTLQFPLRFLDAIRLGDDDDTVYYVVGLVPDWRIHSFVVWMMTAPDGIEAWAPLTQVRVIQEDDDRGRLPFLRAMKLTAPRQRLLKGLT